MNILETKELHHDFGGLQVIFGIDLQVKRRGAARDHRAQRGGENDSLQPDHGNLSPQPRADIL